MKRRPSQAASPEPRPNSKRAVFLDRDGVLNRNIFYADTEAYESPRTRHSLVLAEGAGAALRLLAAAGYRLILVSNQPNAAKGKCSRKQLDQIHARLVEKLAREGVALDAHFYCFHHPDHTGHCDCRKPSPFFLLEAAARDDLVLQDSWMIGDRATDIECGQAAGVRTVWIDNAEGEAAPGSAPARVAHSVLEAAHYILRAANRPPLPEPRSCNPPHL
ncbi:MAG TPA: HAD-IIIA family hydrolase [Acidobacteriaceae bacterium]